jgi:ribosome-associated toxin RatA of RatAB toxin-antitoxin module
MAHAEHREVLNVPFQKLWSVITKYEDYPSFVEGCTKVVVDRSKPGNVRATYSVSMMKDITYTLDHREDQAQGRIEWTYVDSDFFKANSGHWLLKDLGNGKTDATYSLDVDFKIPVPGFILNRLVKGSLPGMVKSFEKKALKS